ncbi:MAG: peptidyl-prolyl cis-trans isomerase [Persicimonas sp.]
MRLHPYIWPAGMAALLLVWTSCAPEKPSEQAERKRTQISKNAETSEFEDEPVLVVDGEEVSLAEFERRVQTLPEYARARYSETTRRQKYLETVAQFEVMADRAEEAGLADDPQVLDALKEGIADQYLDELLREEPAEKVDETAIEAYYEEHREEFREPAARRVAVIEAATREEAERLRERIVERLEGVEGRNKRAVRFRRMAPKHSLDRVTARKGGDFGYIDEPDADPEHRKLSEAAFELEEQGAITPVVEIDDRFGVATLLQEREASVTPLEEASSQIRQRLEREHRREQRRRILERMRDEVDVEVDDDKARDAQRPEEADFMRAEDVDLEEIDPFDESRRAERE